ncbi:MAG: hypothetical protein HQK54_16570 [Oligoflexales bacterium]|nr:hypothetical protein [Oligoflexales bacterium]
MRPNYIRFGKVFFQLGVNHLRFICRVGLLLWVAAGCGSQNHEVISTVDGSLGKTSGKGATFEFLTPKSYRCHTFDSEQVDKVKSKLPDGFVSGYPDSQMPVFYNTITAVPESHLNHLIYTYNKKILQGIFAENLGGAAGLTRLTVGQTEAGFRGWVARTISTTPDMIAFALIHEIGHAVQIKGQETAKQKNLNFTNDLDAMFSELVSKSSLIRSYARSSKAEAWAEAYISYYCSEDSYNFIKNNLPTTYAFLKGVLPEPVWLENGNAIATADTTTTTTPTPSPAPAGTKPPTPTTEIPKTPQTTAQVPSSADSDIHIALTPVDPTGSDPYLYLSTAAQVKNIIICFGTLSQCKSEEQKKLDPQESLNGRNYFIYGQINQSQFEKGLIVAGYDGKNRELSKRSIRFVSKQK